MRTRERLAFITEIAKRDANIGKTGMMKFLYLLQTLYKVPLDYDFEIYTYGPYCQTVMSDIEYAEFADYIKVARVVYPNGTNGYQITAGGASGKILGEKEEILSKYSEKINAVIEFFGPMSAKELELYSTIVFVAASFSDNAWEKSKEAICRTVKNIKPHFSSEIISDSYDDLAAKRFLNW